MQTEFVRYEVADAAGMITLVRTEKRNALSRTLIKKLSYVVDQAKDDANVRVVVLGAEGSAFCAGMDLAEMLETRDAADAHEQWQADAETYRELLLKIVRLPKPTVAAVQGPALAGGMGLVLACDIVVASRSATFGLPEPKRGLVAAVVAPFLVLRVGAGRAGYLMLTGRTVDATEALSLGIAHEAAAPEELTSHVERRASEMAESAPGALSTTKDFLHRIILDQLDRHAELGADVSAEARSTREAREGLQAFLEKRPPDWDGG